MDKLRLEKLYEEKGLCDYKIKTINELCEIHDIKLNQICGYVNLKDNDKEMYKEFLINYYNIHELSYRNIIPLSVYRVLEEDYMIDDFNASGQDIMVKKLIYKMNKKNKIELYEEHIYDGYEESKSRLGIVSSYLNFVCVKNGRYMCIHIKTKNNWY